jgi:lipopolysaccharide transport system permease protein
MIVSIWHYRKFIWGNAWRDLWYRYAGSTIGFFWNVINPLFQILLFTLVFSHVMEVKLAHLPTGFGFAIYLCAGLIPWIGFSETVVRCTNSFVDNANYLKKLAVPEQVFVAQNAGAGFISLIIAMTLLVGVSCLLGHYPGWSWLSLPFILILLQGFGFGLGLTAGVLNAFFRDISQALGLLLQLWFWATPIVYTENILPESLRGWLRVNPMYPFIDALHRVIVDRGWPQANAWGFMSFLAFGFPLVGYLILRKLRPEIRDVL